MKEDCALSVAGVLHHTSPGAGGEEQSAGSVDT